MWQLSDAMHFPLLLIGVIFLNRYFFGLLMKELRQPSKSTCDKSNSTPCFDFKSVTVIVPLYNEGESIYHTLMSIAASDYPQERLQIMAVDDCSGDDSYQWALAAAAKNSRISVIRNSHNMGKRLSIAAAVQRAQSEFIVSVDSDVMVEPDAIGKLLAAFTTPDIAAVGGRVHVINCHVNWLTKMQTIKYFIGYEYLKNLENAFSSVMCLSGCLTAYRRHVLLELEPTLLNRSLFNIPIKYGEDRFLTRQIIKLGYKTKLIVDAHCFTKAPTTIGNYFSQQLRWRRSNIVDFIGGISHIWRINVFVALHYVALQSLILCYPVYLWGIFASGSFFEGMAIHAGILSFYGAVYAFKSQHLAAKYRVNPVHVLGLALMLPLTYMVISVLAAFTLDAGSWETRKVQARTVS